MSRTAVVPPKLDAAKLIGQANRLQNQLSVLYSHIDQAAKLDTRFGENLVCELMAEKSTDLRELEEVQNLICLAFQDC